jgi:hypothetical protein
MSVPIPLGRRRWPSSCIQRSSHWRSWDGTRCRDQGRRSIATSWILISALALPPLSLVRLASPSTGVTRWSIAARRRGPALSIPCCLGKSSDRRRPPLFRWFAFSGIPVKFRISLVVCGRTRFTFLSFSWWTRRRWGAWVVVGIMGSPC